MQSGRMHFQGNRDTFRPRIKNEFRSRKMIIEPYEILGKTVTTIVPEGTKVEESLPKAVEENGGKVFQKWNPQYKKYEIAAVVFRDRALVKNDPDFIATQDFSCFGTEAEKIKKRTIEEAKKSVGGLHIAENEKGIPVIVNKDGSLIFPSPDEMLVNGNKKKIEVLDVPIDPRSREEFKRGAKALAKNDQRQIEKLKKASSEHGLSRDKDIEPTSDYILLDRYTGEEMGAGALNSKLGRNIVFASTEEFVPQKLLIQKFRVDSQIQKGMHQQSAWDWKLHISNTFRNEDIEFPSVYTSFTFDRDGASQTPQSNELKATPEKDALIKQHFDGSMKEKPPVKRPFLAIPEHALVFDGFPIIDRQDKQAFRANEKTARGANPFISKSPKIADQGIRMTKNVKFLVSIVMRKQQSFRNYNTKNETIKNKEPMKTIQAKKPKSVFVIQNQREKPGAKKIMAKAPEKTKKIKANERITKLTKKKEKKKPNPEISKKKKKAKKPAPRKTNPAKTRKQPASKIKIRKAKTAKKIHVSQKPKAKKKKQELEKSELKSIASKNQKPKPSRDKDKEIAKKNRKRKEKEKQAFMKRTRAKSSSRKRAG